VVSSGSKRRKKNCDEASLASSSDRAMATVPYTENGNLGCRKMSHPASARATARHGVERDAHSRLLDVRDGAQSK
jgi:hypothetical protein